MLVITVGPAGVVGGMCTTSVNVAGLAGGSMVIEHRTEPPAPTAGVEHENVGPLFCVSETNVIVPGKVSWN